MTASVHSTSFTSQQQSRMLSVLAKGCAAAYEWLRAASTQDNAAGLLDHADQWISLQLEQRQR
jgi:hypothetical protein